MIFLRRLFLAAAASACLFPALSSFADITPIRHYRLGEGDAGVGHKVTATTSLDCVSENALTMTGTPKYWNHAARGNTNSTYSMLFSPTDKATGAVIPNTDNVCVEAWASTGWRTRHTVVYNGKQEVNGYGIVLTNTQYHAVLGGVGTVGTVSCPPGGWMHLALVCSNGVAAFFTNGVLVASINATPITPVGEVSIGGPSNDGVQPTQPVGFVDDVRFSTFSAGAFDPKDLLYSPGPRLAIARSGGDVVVSVEENRNLARLEATTSLSSPNWQPLDVPENLALRRTWTDTASPAAKFYRFNPVTPPRGSPFPMIKLKLDDVFWPFELTSQGTPEGNGLRSYVITMGLTALQYTKFDAAGSFDPISETTNSLSFNWVVFKSQFYGGDEYSLHGMTGYNSPVLGIDLNAMPELPDDIADAESRFWRVRLTTRHIPYTPNQNQETVFWFRFEYYFSDISLQQSSIYQQLPPLPEVVPGYPIDAARVSTEAP